MPKRDEVIAKSITTALEHGGHDRSIVVKIPAYFSLHWIDFQLAEPEIFKRLRQTWHVDEKTYSASFAGDDGLKSLGDMGFSGSTFYATEDSAYLVKSIPRKFEYSFFKNDLLTPYAEHMQNNLGSLLVRITDFLEPRHATIGSAFGTAPSHHIVMENTKYGQEDDRQGVGDTAWETYDLKPLSYFYPERDVADGAFATDEALSKLADRFDDKLVLDLDIAESFKAQLEKDTVLLARCNAVDYSLFLVRIPAHLKSQQTVDTDTKQQAPLPPAAPPFVPPDAPNWRTGMQSADGKWMYRVSILDFFWAKHKATAKLMTGLIKSYNVVDKQGPMSITTNSTEYRDRFLKMCKDMIAIKDVQSKI